MDFQENSPHQEGIITETYITPDQSYLEQSQELTNLVNTSKLVQKYLPRYRQNSCYNQERGTKGTYLPLPSRTYRQVT